MALANFHLIGSVEYQLASEWMSLQAEKEAQKKQLEDIFQEREARLTLKHNAVLNQIREVRNFQLLISAQISQNSNILVEGQATTRRKGAPKEIGRVGARTQ